MSLRVIFMGTPDFAVPTLAAISGAGHEVAAVYTQPPRAAGRGQKQRQSPVQVFAEAEQIPVVTTPSLRSTRAQQDFATLEAEVAVVVAYGLILPKPVLDAPKHGCLNLHASLLPRWRGAAPIQRAVMAGDTRSGVMVMRMDEGLDTGPVCLAEDVPIAPDMTAGDLHDALAPLGADLVARALAALERGSLECRPQSGEATYARKILKEETRINWELPARDVHNHARGLSPFPGAWFELQTARGRERVKMLRTTVARGSGPPGKVLSADLTVACGEGAVRLLQVQRAGRRPMSAEEFSRGVSVKTGTVLR